MKIEKREEPYGSFTVEFSEKFETQLRRAANEIVAFAKKDPAEAEKLMDIYRGMIESSVSLLLSIIGLGFFKPKILSYVFNTLRSCLEPLSDHLKRDQEGQNWRNN